MGFNIDKPWLTLDDWQKKYIATEGNCFLLCGRQVGKTTAMSLKAGMRAIKKPNSKILMIALTERQAYNLFFKTLRFLESEHPRDIVRGTKRPTRHIINLKNGSQIMCHATGKCGDGLRTYTLTDLFIDEASRIDDNVFTATTPMLSVTGGVMDIASTPVGKQGYFYEASKREDFTKFYISSEDCPRHKPEFLEMQKKTMSKLEYAQEYLAVFLDELKRVFSDELINKCCVLKRREKFVEGATYFMGLDIARLGDDDTAFEIIDRINKEKLEQVESIITSRTRLNETSQKVLDLEKVYHFKKIYIDDAGVGGGVFDYLLQETKTKNKIVSINNSSRPLDKDEKRKTKILKEDLYSNLLILMEQDKIKLLDDDEIIASLKSIQYEYVIKSGQESRLRIFGDYTHIVEGLIRACFCSRDKTLNIWVAY